MTSFPAAVRSSPQNERALFKVVWQQAKRYSGIDRRRTRKAVRNQALGWSRPPLSCKERLGFRDRDESGKLCWEDVLLEKDPEIGRELLVWRTERGPKTRQGSSETGHRRPFSPKLFATGDARCQVKFYKAFEEHRLDEMKKPAAPF